MKIKKIMMFALTSLFSISLASCGENSSKTSVASNSTNTQATDKTTDSDTTPKEKTISYQFAGQDTSMASYGFAYSYYLNLYSDGKIDGYGYKMYSLNTDSAETNTDYTQWFTGSWKTGVDDNDDPALKAVVKYVEGLKSATGEALSGSFNYNISFASDNKTPLAISQFSIPIGLSGRQVTLEYNATPYATGDAFIAATVYKFVEPTGYKAYFEDVDNKDRIYLLAKGKGNYYGAVLKEDKSLKGYYPKEEVTWSYSNNELSITISGAKHVVTIASDNKGTMEWEETIYGDYKTKHNFACADVSSLTTEEVKSDAVTYPKGTIYFTYNYYPSYSLKCTFSAGYQVWATAIGDVSKAYTNTNSEEELFAFTNDDSSPNATFKLYKNGTFKFHNAFGSQNIDFDGTFTYASYKFTFTTNNNDVEVTETSIAS